MALLNIEDLGLGDDVGGLGEGTVTVEDLNVSSAVEKATLFSELDVLLALEVGETPLLGDDDTLLTSELELGTTETLNHTGNVLLSATNGHKDLTNVDTSGNTDGLTEGTTHTGLETIRTSTGQHLVDTKNVEGVDTHTEMETILTGDLGEVLVGADTSSLKSLRRDHLTLEREDVNSGGELLNGTLLLSDIIDTDAWVRDTTAEAGLGVRLTRKITVAIQDKKII